MSVNPNDAIQNYLNQIQQEYSQAEKDITEMEKDASELEKLESNPEYKKLLALEAKYAKEGKPFPAKYQKELDKLQAPISALTDDLDKCEAELDLLDPSFESLNDTINSLLEAVTTTQGNTGSAQLNADLATIAKYMGSVFVAMKDQLQADEYQAMIQDDTGDQLSDAQIEALAQKMIQNETAAEQTLTNLFETMSNDILSYHEDYDNAKADHAKYSAAEWAFDVHHAKSHEHQDRVIMSNATAMISAITSVMGTLTPAITTLMPEFSQLELTVQTVIKKIMKILNSKTLPPKEKQEQILSLMMFLLGFFNVIQQTVQTKKAENAQLLAQANLDASKMNIDDAQMNQTIQAEEIKNAKVLQILMFVAKLIVGTLMTIFAPGVGSAILMAALTIADTTGGPFGQSLIDKLTNAIAKSTGHTWAEVITTMLEIVVAAGGGAALDAGISAAADKGVQAAVETAIQAAQTSIKEAAMQAAAAVGKAGDEAATEAAETTLQEIGEKAAQKAAQNTARQFANQSVATQLQMVAKGTYKELLETAIDKAAKEAVEQAVVDGSALAREAAREAVAITGDDLQLTIDAAANKGLAKAMGKTVEEIAKVNESLDRSALKTALSRGLYAGIYGAASNNLLLDTVLAIAKKYGANNDDATEDQLKLAMQIIQGLIAMFAQMVGGGSLAQVAFENAPQGLTKLATFAEVGATAAEASANLGMYNVLKAQAQTEKVLSITASLAEMLQSNGDQMRQDTSKDNDNFLRILQQEQAQLATLAGHLHDGDIAGIHILQA